MRPLLIIDVESTCWEKEIPQGSQSEIIQIGIAELKQNSEIIKHPPIYVKPIKSSVSNFCETLTGITQKTLDRDGLTYQQSLNILKTKFKIKDRIWCTWGDYDRKMFEKMCVLNNLNMNTYFGNNHLNVKAAFGASLFEKPMGVSNALKRAGMKFEGRPHDGADDAYNIAKLIGWMYEYGV